MKSMQGIILKIRDSIFFGLFLFLFLIGNSDAFDFPAAAWHRGDTSFAQENSHVALERALHSASPNIEVDIIDFINQDGNRVGLVSHDYKMRRATGLKGAFSDQYHDLLKLPKNHANQELTPEPFVTVIDLFELIKARSNYSGCILA